MKYLSALNLAESLMERGLKPGCERIEIAGSLRRQVVEVNDIEFVAIPKAGAPRPMFGEKPYKRWLEYHLDQLARAHAIEPIKGGDKYKQFWLLKDRLHMIKVDLFIVTPPAQWGVQMVIRTGPNKPENNFSQWMVTTRAKGGALPNTAQVELGAVHGLNGVIPMPEEKDFFEFCGLPWVEPRERRARWRSTDR